jgi:poly-gamma-glutamate capsule biosynthesis protein CapA/YwtB (metallophosphatase superfamily)
LIYSDDVALLTLFLGGDVMTGRGVDQILPLAGDPRLWEAHARDARTYVELAERVNGPIAKPVDVSWPWGDALAVLNAVEPDLRLINLETSVTRSDDVAHGKAVNYRMAPENIGCLTVVEPDICALANNHVLDFGQSGLDDTLRALAAAGIPAVGAGRDATEAAAPVRMGRVVVVSAGTTSSGIPQSWAATQDRPGVNLLPDLSATTADRLVPAKRPSDLAVVSIHWGPNWGYQVPAEHVEFAHRLIDGGVDLIHGHSSHHPLPIEVYRGKLILYGCGDLIDDYEGIGGHEGYRDDLRLLYFPSLEASTGRLVGLRMDVVQARQLRLHHASSEDAEFVRDTLNRVSHRFGTRVEPAPDATLVMSPL